MTLLNQFTDDQWNEEPESADVIPAGTYIAEMVGTEMITTRAGHPMLKCEFKISEGQPHGNRRFWNNYNLGHPNATVAQRAFDDFKRLVRACDRLKVTDARELCGIRFGVTLRIRKQEGYDDQNAMGSVKRAAEVQAAQSATSAPRAAPMAAPAPQAAPASAPQAVPTPAPAPAPMAVPQAAPAPQAAPEADPQMMPPTDVAIPQTAPWRG